MASLEICLAPFFSFRLTKLRFAVHNDAPQPRAFDRRTGLHRTFRDLGNVLTRNPDDRLWLELESRPHARRIIFEWDEKSMIVNGHAHWYKQRF